MGGTTARYLQRKKIGGREPLSVKRGGRGSNIGGRILHIKGLFRPVSSCLPCFFLLLGAAWPMDGRLAGIFEWRCGVWNNHRDDVGLMPWLRWL